MKRYLAAAAVFSGTAFAIWMSQRRARRQLGDIDGRTQSAIAMPKEWWRKRPPAKDKLCYRTKTDALNVFREFNQGVIDNYGGESAVHRTSDFEAVNQKYEDIPYSQQANTIAKALWLSMPPHPPYCLDEIDLDALNQTAPGENHPVGFRLPDFAEELVLAKKEQERWAQWEEEYQLEPVPF